MLAAQTDLSVGFKPTTASDRAARPAPISCGTSGPRDRRWVVNGRGGSFVLKRALLSREHSPPRVAGLHGGNGASCHFGPLFRGRRHKGLGPFLGTDVSSAERPRYGAGAFGAEPPALRPETSGGGTNALRGSLHRIASTFGNSSGFVSQFGRGHDTIRVRFGSLLRRGDDLLPPSSRRAAAASAFGRRRCDIGQLLVELIPDQLVFFAFDRLLVCRLTGCGQPDPAASKEQPRRGVRTLRRPSCAVSQTRMLSDRSRSSARSASRGIGANSCSSRPEPRFPSGCAGACSGNRDRQPFRRAES